MHISKNTHKKSLKLARKCVDATCYVSFDHIRNDSTVRVNHIDIISTIKLAFAIAPCDIYIARVYNGIKWNFVRFFCGQRVSVSIS